LKNLIIKEVKHMPIGRVSNLPKRAFNVARSIARELRCVYNGLRFRSDIQRDRYEKWKIERLIHKKEEALLGKDFPGHQHWEFYSNRNGRLGHTTTMGVPYRFIDKK
jgi:hypothetical protein